MNAELQELIRIENMDENGFGPRTMRRLKVCSGCGAVATASRIFCKECGHKLPRGTLYQRYKEKHRSCTSCDTVVSDRAQYCPQCGEKII